MKKKVTLLTGAGFTSSFNGITTKSLTEKIVDLNVEGVKINDQNPGVYFKSLLERHYKTKDDLDCVNFETIIHLLEEMYSYYVSCYPSGKKIDLSKRKGVKPSFLQVKRSIDEKLKAHLSRENEVSAGIKDIFILYIDAIIHELESFNNDINNIGMTRFSDFISTYLTDSKWGKRIYTLNYDAWISKHMGYYDGFGANGLFDREGIIRSTKQNVHYNLHGCINWDREWGEVRRIKDCLDFKKYKHSSLFSLNREPLLVAPIITGYNKLSRMNYSPYLELYFSFQQDVIDSDLLIIIGYSFSDNHINNILSMYNGAVIVVTYFPELTTSSTTFLTRSSKNYLDRITLNGNGLVNYKITGSVIFSENNVKVWGKGIGDEFYQEFVTLI